MPRRISPAAFRIARRGTSREINRQIALSLVRANQCGAEALGEYMRRGVGADVRPGIVVSVATSGDLLQWHVHLHVLATDGAFSDDGTFHPLANWDAEALMRLFRERLLARLVVKHAISGEATARRQGSTATRMQSTRYAAGTSIAATTPATNATDG